MTLLRSSFGRYHPVASAFLLIPQPPRHTSRCERHITDANQRANTLDGSTIPNIHKQFRPSSRIAF